MKHDNRKRKICFAATFGGHFEQLMMLEPLMKKYDSFIVTERTPIEIDQKGIPIYYLRQVNRREKTFLLTTLINTLISLKIIIFWRPDIVITTGALAIVPICLLVKVFRKKLIYIESFAKTTTSTKSGKLLYKFADQFYVQWENMLTIYPNAIYLGGIY